MGCRQRKAARAKTARQDHRSANHRLNLPRLAGSDRRALLTGTALASTLLIAMMAAPTPAHAVVNCLTGAPAAPLPIFNSENDSIICVNTEARNNPPESAAIALQTLNGNQYINLNNSGTLTTSLIGNAFGISTETAGTFSDINIVNSGDIQVTALVSGIARGIFGRTEQANSAVDIENSGDVEATSATENAYGIRARSQGTNSALDIVNTGDLTATSMGDAAYSISTRAQADSSTTSIVNSGDMAVMGVTNAFGIRSRADGTDSGITISNTGDIQAITGATARGISAQTIGARSAIGIVNSGDMTVLSTSANAYGIHARTSADNSSIDIRNSGDMTVSETGGIGLYAQAIYAETTSANSSIFVQNSGDLTANSPTGGQGIAVYARGLGSHVTVVNSGDLTTDADGIYVFSGFGDVSVTNSGTIVSGNHGIRTGTFDQGANHTITNSGDVSGAVAGIFSYAYSADTTIINSGSISAGSQLAIDVNSSGPGTAKIYNSGTITGFVDLTEQDDLFVNQSGGVFETKLTSLFGGGNDLFRNEAGGTIQAATDASMSEMSSFEGLERFENRGTISMVDGAAGDSFTISNTPGGTDLDFVASGNSRLAVDTFLGGPGSISDTLTIEGSVSGTTTLAVNNINPNGGVFNSDGIRVVTATGATPNANAFSLDAPIDAGFFDYDLFFTPTGSGFWSLKSFPGAGAQLLPQLTTAAQDMWHQGSSTWFDRTADLRVLVNGGGASAESYGAAPNDGIAPAVWVRGSGGWLDRDSSGSTSANGRTYQFDLDRELETMDFQMGLDLGSRDLLSQGDALVFGLLGGFVHGDLDYDNINRNFDYDGGQVGVYATYMKGGLFVDTLLNVHIMELDANGALGFPNNDLDATTVGLRSDAGYRFGSFSGGAFLEPLATLEVTWADIDGFSQGGNSVKFDDDANIRGRLGLRAGTTMEAWEGTMMEPFVTGSLWSNLSGENQATLASNGSTFRFEDDIDDVWGEVSAGVNFFNFSETTSVFAKVDVTFGEDVSGVGGKAGMRVAW